MYQAFFSLNKKPFSISPDPDFLFLSGRHKEAITHLQHGLLGHSGFVLLTGEVGTGKTTISRSLIEGMKDDTDIVFILNPAISEIELLTTICDNFNIEYQRDDLSSLFNELSSWIISNHLNNRRTVVLIDEAQHLSFAALEQLRLLTDLETSNKKPLQVILIGQTELQEKLKQDGYNHLAQSITARYHLLSLTQQESSAYIQHRLGIAGSTHAIFDKSALKEIFKRCNGTPRLTNILCDRSLLAAYTENSHFVTLDMVKEASKEVHFSHSQTKRNYFLSHWRLAILTFLTALTVFQTPKILQYVTSLDNITPIKEKVSFNSDTNLENITETVNRQWFDAYPQLALNNVKYANALSTLYSIWGYRVEESDANCKQGEPVLLNCYTHKINFKKLKQLNYPGVIRLEKDIDTTIYAVIYKISDNYQLIVNGYLITVSEQWLKNYWSGDITILWKAPFPLKGTIKFGQNGEEVTWLANQLNKDQGWPSEHKTRFDLRLVEQVSAFQREQGLMDDGIVGPRTFMPLMHLASPNSPRLSQEIN